MSTVRNDAIINYISNTHRTYSINGFPPFEINTIILYVYKKINIGKF